jgi:hypothetical protein
VFHAKRRSLLSRPLACLRRLCGKMAPFVVRSEPRCHRVATLPQLPDRADGNVLIQFQSCEAANFWATG